MRLTTRSTLTSLTLTAVCLTLAGSAHASSGTWLGTQNAFWTNSANWSASPYPGAADTASFTGGGSGQTALDLSGLPGVLNITFDTAGVAPYTIGAGTANSQTNILRDNGEIKLSSTAGSSQTFKATVRLGPDTTSASYSLRNDNPAQTLTFNAIGAIAGGTKTLNLNGTGPISVLGPLDKGAGTLNLYDKSSSSLSLAGNSTVTILQIDGTNSVINLASGTTTTISNGGGSGIMASQDCTINGPGTMFLSTSGGDNHLDNGAASGKTLTINAKLTGATGFEFWHGSYYGTIALNGTNDYTLSTVINVPGTIQLPSLANKGVACSLGTGSTFVLNAVGSRFRYVGAGDTSDRTLDVRLGGILEQAGTGTLKLTAPIISTTSGAKTLVLQGSTAGVGEFGGALVNGSGTLSLTKDGTGTWTLSSTNTYSGATLVTNGTLAISGALGSLQATSAITVMGGAALALNTTASANNTNRLADSAPIALQGGSLTLSNDAGATNFFEKIGVVTVGAGANTIAVSPAGSGQSSVLSIASLARTGGGTLNFSGAGIGDSDQNRVFIAGLADGPLGPWATVNGTSYAAYSGARGIYASSVSVTNIAARGPSSVIPNDASADVHITTAGDTGDIVLASDATGIFSLRQDTATDATVSTANKTLQTMQVGISAGQANLTIGDVQGDGAIATLTSPGDLTLNNDDATAVLTVNAAVTNNTSASSLSKTGTGKVLLNGPFSYTGATGIGGGTLAFGGSLTQTLASAINGPGALRKEGTGRLTLSGANSYTGQTVVSQGTLLVQNSSALGTADGGTVIQSGATLDLGGTLGAQALNLNAEQITVAGSGVNGRGAIVNSSGNSQYNALRLVTLAGDTTFGGEPSGARWDVRNASGTATLTMNDFTITKVGSNQVGLTGVTVLPGKGSIDIREGSFTVEVGTTLGGGPTNVMTVRSGAVFDIYDLYSPIAWSLTMENGAHFYVRNDSAANRNVWAGPVTLNGTALFDAAGSYRDYLTGPISGAGSVIKTTGGSTTYFSGTNTYAGTTAVSNGTLNALYARSLPGYNEGRLTLGGSGMLMLPTGDGNTGWSADQIRALHDASQLTTNTATLGIDTTLANLNYAGNFTKPMALNILGTNTATLAGTNTFGGTLTVNGAKVNLTGSGTHVIGSLVLSGNSSFVVSNASDLCVSVLSNCYTYIGNGSADFGRMTLAGNAAWTEYRFPANVWQNPIYVGNNGRGILTIQDSASITQCLYVGNASSAAGAVYQNGGTMHNWGGAGSDGRIGMTGYGYYELNSGTFTNNGYFQVGRDNAGVGILRQTGGAFKMGSVYGGQLGISRGGTGVVYTTGGTFATSAGVNVGDSSDNNCQRGFAELTLGGSARANVAGTVYMADRTNMFAILNLNGGTLAATMLSKSSSRTGSVAIVNFNGGTLQARSSGSLIGTGANAPDGVFLYAGGATIDTTNQTCSIGVPLRAPAGSGVSAIAVTPRGGYMGPPFVTISGGGGTGATAVAQFDSGSGTVTGITVTSPGCGYTNVPTVTLSGGGTNVQTALGAVTLTPNVSGGLTKLGNGTLSLSATNTYSGATTVSNGTLFVAIREALPSGTDINVSGGSLDLGGFTLTNRTVSATGGSIVNGALVCDALTKSGSDTLALAAPIKSAAPIAIGGGTLRFSNRQPGLYEGIFTNNFNTTDANPKTAVRLTTRAANGSWGSSAASGGIWLDNSTYIYSGYVWNRATTNQTWTFAEQFDDSVLLKIDGNTVLNNGGWNSPTTGTIAMSPGAHAFELRLGQGGGGVAAPTAYYSWWTSYAFSFGVDYQGRNDTNVANFAVMTDPGDGSLFTLTPAGNSPTNLLDSSTAVTLAADAVWDLGGFYQTVSNLSGAGLISNGTLVVTGDLAPAGTNAIGTLSLDCSLSLAGGSRLLVDLASDGTSDLLSVHGGLTLDPASSLQVANPGQLNTHKIYIVATVTGARSGTFGSLLNVPSRNWHLSYGNDGSIKLIFSSGSILMLK